MIHAGKKMRASPLPPSEQEGDLLHCLREFEDRVDDGRISVEGEEMEPKHNASRSQVQRPRASLPTLLVSLVEGMTGAMSSFKLNWYRDASPIEMTLLRAR